MRKIVLLFFVCSALQGRAQVMETKDSLVSEICKSVSRLQDLDDSVAFWTAVSTPLEPFFSRMEKKVADQAWMYINMRLQRNCKHFSDFLKHLYPVDKGDWEELDTMPAVKASTSECRSILDYKTLAYLEGNGDTVHLDLNKDYWIDRFDDGTYSKLSFRWLTECEFEISFIESNNRFRKNLSKPGDKYRYTLIEKKDHYYEVVAEVVGSGNNDLTKFRIYF